MGAYNADAYHRYTTTCVGNTVDYEGRCTSCHKVSISARVSTTATNEVCQPNVRTVEITVIRSAQEVLEDLEVDESPEPPPMKPPAYKPVVRKINDGWKAKWRLTQQRPRDGLR